MKKFINLYTILGASFLFLFILLIILLCFDKAVIAENGYEVGLSHINNLVNYSYKENVDLMSDLIFYVTFIVVIYAFSIGLYQLIKKKSLYKVDKSIIIFGIALVIAIIVWLLFDKVIELNIRPTHKIEGSFPSTHVMLATFFALSCHGFLCLRDQDKLIKYSSLVLAIIIIVIVTITRVIAGVHYITDVCGGLFIGLSFYFCTFGLIKAFDKKVENDEKEE